MTNAKYGQSVPLYPELNTYFTKSGAIDIIVSFVMKSGIALLESLIRAATEKGVYVRVLTSTYMNVSDPTALTILWDCIGSGGEIRLYNGGSNSFHPKAYIFHGEESDCIFVGSSNISKTALTDGVEWNYKIEKKSDRAAFCEFAERFEYLFENEAIVLTDEILKDYRDYYIKQNRSESNINKHFKKYQRLSYNKLELDLSKTAESSREYMDYSAEDLFGKTKKLYSPNDAQTEALIELKRTRAEGNNKALVIAATGLGKTFLAAFDSVDYNRILFIAHREEILNQAFDTFSKVRGKEGLGRLFDGQYEYHEPIIFASVQTMTRDQHLEKFNPEAFDYIVFDEFHHAASDSYRKIISYFNPKFMLGITATPYRMDTQNVFELCDYNVVYEADLFTSINRDWLCPFYYYGIYDYTVDYNNVTYINGKYHEKELEQVYNNNSRADLILEHYRKWKGKRALGFCCSINHAEYMTKYFNENGINSVSVHSGNESEFRMERKTAIEMLKEGKIEVIFSVDMFNEGVDIPLIDTIMFLRATESSTVFLQQLGRGLRKAEGKKKVRVLDFIGNFKKASMIPALLGGRKLVPENYQVSNSRNTDKSIREIVEDEELFPSGCRIDFEFQVIKLIDEMTKAGKRLEDIVFDKFLEGMQQKGTVLTRMEFFESLDTELYRKIKASGKQNPFSNYLGYIEKLAANRKISKESIVKLSDEARVLVEFIEKTSMSQLYKIPVLQAFIKDNNLKTKISESEITESFKRFYGDAQNSKDIIRNKGGKDYMNWTDDIYRKLAYNNPVHFLCKTHSNIFRLKSDTKELEIILNLREDTSNEIFVEQVKDALHYRRSEFLTMRLS